MAVDVLVIGSGIVGSVVAHQARERGLEVLVFDPAPEQSASRAALALGRAGWHRDVQRARASWSVKWYLAHGWLTFPPAVVTKKGEMEPRNASDYYLIDPIKPLVEPDVIGPAVPVEGGVNALGERYEGRLTVVAAGPRTWGLCKLPAGGIRWGHTVVLPGAKTIGPLAIHLYAPYKAVIVVRTAEGARVGSSVATDYATSRNRVYWQLELAKQIGIVEGGEKDGYEISGVRSLHPEETGKPVWVNDRLVALAGFARCGYSLAPARVSEVLDRAFGVGVAQPGERQAASLEAAGANPASRSPKKE